MVRLIDRNRQIPNGLSAYQPETGWRPAPYSSFDTIVRGLISHRMGNPYLTQKNGWSTDYNTVADEVDRFNSLVCKQMGWSAYIYTDEGIAPPPKLNSPGLAPRLRAAAAGASALSQWLGEGGQPVPNAQAEARAQVCVTCPQNQPAELLDLFTEKASNFIRKQLEKRNEMKLSTTVDDKLHICRACTCPIRLMVFTPIEYKLKALSPESKKALVPFCWVLAEEKSLTRQ